MIARERSRVGLNGVREAASVSVHWSSERPNYAQQGNEKSIVIRPLTAGPEVPIARETRPSVIGWPLDSANLETWRSDPSHHNWRAPTNDIFRVSTSHSFNIGNAGSAVENSGAL
jgi:hypothetical protein